MDDSYSCRQPFHFTVPKRIKIKNKKLGFLFRVLQLFFLALVVGVKTFNKAWISSYTPFAGSFSVWQDAGDPALTGDSSVDHCSNLSPYDYVYNARFKYSPRHCKKLSGSKAFQKAQGASSVFIPTFASERNTWEGYGADCGAASEASCKARGAAWDYQTASGECSCVSEDEYFAQNPEFDKVTIIHGYTVETGSDPFNFQKGVSWRADQLHREQGKTFKENAEIHTKFYSKMTGEECIFGNRETWTVEDVQQGLSFTPEELLACLGLDLDKQYDDYRSYDEAENKAPYLRQTGVIVTATMYFQNSAVREGFDYHNIVQCNIFLDAALSWNSITTADVLAAPNPTGNYSVRVDTLEHGITINFVVSGNFGYFSFSALLTALVDVIIILKIPLKIIELVCFHLLGARSQFYRNAIIEKFYLPSCVCGLLGRKIGYAAAFQTLSKQLHREMGDLHKLDADEFTRLIAKFLKQYGRHDILDDKELQMLGSFLYAAYDVDDSGTVGMNEWVNVASFNEPMRLQEVATLFDMDRKPSFWEKVFDDGITRYIKKTHNRRSRKSTILNGEHQALGKGSVDPDSTEDGDENDKLLRKADLDALELKLQARINALETCLTETHVVSSTFCSTQELSREELELWVPHDRIFLHPDLSQNENASLQHLLRQHEESAARIQSLERALEKHLDDSRQLINEMFEDNLNGILGDSTRVSEQKTGEATKAADGGEVTRAGKDKIAHLVFDVAEMKGTLSGLDRQVETLSATMHSLTSASRQTLAVYPPMRMPSLSFAQWQQRASLQTSRSTSLLAGTIDFDLTPNGAPSI